MDVTNIVLIIVLFVIGAIAVGLLFAKNKATDEKNKWIILGMGNLMENLVIVILIPIMINTLTNYSKNIDPVLLVLGIIVLILVTFINTRLDIQLKN